jgi:hypothetical protein
VVGCCFITINIYANILFVVVVVFLVQREDGGFDSGVEEEKNKCVSPPPPEKPTGGGVQKKSKTSGVFKGDGKKLSEVYQEKEVVQLNPKQAPSNNGRNPLESSVAQVSKSGNPTEDFEKIEEEDGEGNNYDSGNRVYSIFTPMYMMYELEDDEAEECCAVIVNLPSGVAAGALRGKISTKVDTSMLRLHIKVEWPESLTCVDSLQDALVETLMDKYGNRRATSILHHLVLGHKKEVNKIGACTGIGRSQFFSSKCVIPLPFKCITKPIVIKTVNCRRTESYNVYMVFKRWKKVSEDSDMDFEVHRSSATVGMGRDILPIMQSRGPKYTMEDLHRMTYGVYGGTTPTVASTHDRTYVEHDGGTVASAVTEF